MGHRHRALLPAAALCCAVALGGPSLRGQTPTVSISTGIFEPVGDDFAETHAGPGVDAVFRLAFGRVEVGVGGQWNANGVPFAEDDWSTRSYFLEGRYRWLRPGRTVNPFVAGRFGRTGQTVEVNAGKRTTAGWGGGVVLGIELDLQSRTWLQIGLPLYRVAFDDYEIDGRRFDGTESSGGLVGLVVGASLAFTPEPGR